MAQRVVRRFRVLVPVVVLLGLLTTIWTPMPSAFAAAPTITGFSPTSGGNGTRVVITGTNFSGSQGCVVDRVRFGGINAISYVVNSATQVTATVGTGATGTVRVRTSGGTGCAEAISVGTFTWTAVTYTVTYNGNGNTGGMVAVDGTTPYASGGTVTVLGNTGMLVKTGYAFANWNTAANGSGTSYSAGNTFAIGTNTILYAQWVVTYTVTYNGNGKTGGASPVDGSSPYVSGATVTVLGNTGGLVRTGNTFANWNTAADGSGTSYAGGNTFVIGANTILYAQWVAAVTYSANGATGGSVPVDGSSPYLNGATVTVLGNTGSLVRTGYTFNNWNTAADGSGSSYAGGNTFAIGADTVLYAQWAAITYTVTYNGNGATSGTVPVDGSSPYASGATVTVLSNSGVLFKTGYGFLNWNTAANGSGTSYAPSATFTISTNTILYAQWAATYTVTYNGNGATGGSVPVDGSSPYFNGTTVTVLSNSGLLVKIGNTFAGWNTAANGSGTSYAPSATFAIAANMVLYAQWTLGGNYTVTYDANGATGGSVPVDGSSPYSNGTTITVLGNSGLLVKTGNTFANWNTAADGSGTSYAPSNTFVIGVDTILYAQWAPDGSYTVAYNGNGSTGGTVPDDTSSPYLSGGTVTILGNTGSLIKTGYTFNNWNTAANGSGTSYSGGNTFTIAANTILYVQWTIAYSVTYDANGATGGTVPVDGSSPYLNGATVTVLGNTGSLVKTGNTFAGWNTAANGSGTSYAPSVTFAIAADMVLYSQWTATLTYDANGATGGTAPIDGSSPYSNGTIVTVLSNSGSLVKTGYTFNNWNTAANGSGTSYSGGNTFAIAANTILYAQWPAITYTLSYNANGATSGTVPVDGSSPYASGGTVTVRSNTGSLVKTGYTFARWNTAANGSGTSYSGGNTFAIVANTILYAQWTIVYTVIYRPAGSTAGTAPVDVSSPYASGATVTVLGNSGSLVRTGTTFDNWNTALDGSGTSYSIGNTFLIGANTLLYVQWRATVTYNGNGSTGGSVPVDASSPYLAPYINNLTVTVLGNTGSLVRAGYTFDHWCTTPDNSGQHYMPSDTFAITANTVLYAQWAPIGSYLVSYNDNGSTSGTAPVDASSPYLSGSTVTILGNTGSLAKTDSTFANWNTEPDGSGTSYAPSATFAIGASVFLYAQWIVPTPPVPPSPPPPPPPPTATIETPVTELVRADATGDTVVYATILGIGGIPFIVSVTIPAGAISRDITITIAPATTPAEISSGFIVIRVTATDSSGTSVTQFAKPLIINLGHVNAGASVVFSQDKIVWTPIQLLSGTTLPDGMQEGYYVAVDADTIILTRHLTYFGVKMTQVRLRVLSSAYILNVGESATLTAIGGSGSGVIGYVTTTPSICSVSDAGLVRALTAGVCIVEATKSADGTYMNVLSLPLNLTIQKLVQAPFTLISSADILSVGGSSTVTTSGGSGDGVVKFSTTTPTYCSVSDAGLVKALVTGNCIVEATKAGNDTYLEVSAWPLYLTIERVLSVPAPSPTPDTTVNGEVLPKTGSPWYNLLTLGIGLILLGGVGWAQRKRSKPYSVSTPI